MTSLLFPVATGVAALLAVLGLIWLAARLVRATGFAQSRARHGMLAVEESLSLDPRRRLLLIRCEHGRVLLMTGGAADLVVGWLPAPKGDDP
jgi:flagellar protein FliO/FliZ